MPLLERRNPTPLFAALTEFLVAEQVRSKFTVISLQSHPFVLFDALVDILHLF